MKAKCVSNIWRKKILELWKHSTLPHSRSSAHKKISFFCRQDFHMKASQNESEEENKWKNRKAVHGNKEKPFFVAFSLILYLFTLFTNCAASYRSFSLFWLIVLNETQDWIHCLELLNQRSIQQLKFKISSIFKIKMNLHVNLKIWISILFQVRIPEIELFSWAWIIVEAVDDRC